MPANTSFDDIVTTTLRNRSGKLADNATVTTALLDRLRRKGKVKPAAGGRTIVQELETGLNSNGSWYAGYDTLSTVAFEPFSAAEYDWKQAYVPVVWSGMERRKNMGEFEVIDLIASRIKNGEKSLYDLVAQAVYSAGTSYGGKQLQGLGHFVVASPTTGTVGGINRATAGNEFWRNQVNTVDFDTAINAAGSSGTLPTPVIKAMNALQILCTRGIDKPDLIVADSTAYQRYAESLLSIQQIQNTEMAASGFQALKFHFNGQTDVVLDNGYCTAKTMFFLNTDFLYLRSHPDLNFQPLGGERVPVNQDAVVRFLGFMGNMAASNCARQGVLSDS